MKVNHIFISATKRTPRGLALLLGLAMMICALLLGLQAAKPAQAAGTTFTVNSTADPGDGTCNATECTLREALTAANATTTADTIKFNLSTTDAGYNSTTGVFIIAPSSALPVITRTVIIDGYSQGKSTANTTSDDAKPNSLAVGDNAVLKIELSGANIPAGSFVNGLEIQATNSTVKGLVINRWSEFGVYIFKAGAAGNKVMGNYIGTDKSGTLDLGNSFYGVLINDAPSNMVGDTKAAARNIISGNDSSGVLIYGTTATGDSILSNSIFSNGGLGIDLSLQGFPPDGRTDNDGGSPPDQDTGPNNLQNFPELTSASTTTITGTLNSTPKKTFIIQFFSSPAGQDEGKKLLGSKQVSTDVNGNISIGFISSKSIPTGLAITATATLVSDPATGATGDLRDLRSYERGLGL